MKREGILIFTNEKVLKHKQQDGSGSKGRYCYWTLGKFPIKFIGNVDTELRIYFAVKGQVKGYFIIDGHTSNELYFDSDSWVEIPNGEILKPSQGWRYYLHN